MCLGLTTGFAQPIFLLGLISVKSTHLSSFSNYWLPTDLHLLVVHCETSIIHSSISAGIVVKWMFFSEMTLLKFHGSQTHIIYRRCCVALRVLTLWLYNLSAPLLVFILSLRLRVLWGGLGTLSSLLAFWLIIDICNTYMWCLK